MPELPLPLLLDMALANFYAFSLVLVRMSGLMTIGPLFGQSVVPANLRVLLVVVMSLLITPALRNHADTGFHRLDADGSGSLSRDEVPDPLQSRFDSLLGQAGRSDDEGLTADEFRGPLVLPSTILDYAWIAASELLLGLALGLGVFSVMSGLQLAGQLIDQQTGIGLGEIFDPDFDASGSIGGQALFLLGTTIFLMLEPLNGHLMMVSALVETFQTLPVGEAAISPSVVDLLRDTVHLSLVLALRIAAPLLAVMSLLALTMGFLGHSVPQINVLVIGFAVRATVSLLLFSIAFSGVGTVITDTVPMVIDQLRSGLTFLP